MRIRENRENLIGALITAESHESAQFEIEMSIRALENIYQEPAMSTPGNGNLNISVFLPQNLPLYSIVLMAAIPHLLAKSTFMKPSHLSRDLYQRVHEILFFDDEDLTLCTSTRRVFTEAFASVSDVVIFAGEHYNALKLAELCPNALFIHLGHGPNPMVLLPDGDIDKAAYAASKARCFNSGQDCSAPDIIFIPSNMKRSFIETLSSYLEKVLVGDYSDPRVTVGPIRDEQVVRYCNEFIRDHQELVVYGGHVDVVKQLVFPTIMYSEHRDPYVKCNDLFAPLFFVVGYENPRDLDDLLRKDIFTEYAMFLSVFTTSAPPAGLIDNKLETVIINGSPLANEDPNRPFGGYGSRASAVRRSSRYESRPILISTEIARHFGAYPSHEESYCSVTSSLGPECPVSKAHS